MLLSVTEACLTVNFEDLFNGTHISSSSLIQAQVVSHGCAHDLLQDKNTKTKACGLKVSVLRQNSKGGGGR